MEHSNVYLNVDGGKVWNNGTPINTVNTEELSSIAMGLKMLFKHSFNASIERAQPVYRWPDIRRTRTPRVFLNLYWKITG